MYYVYSGIYYIHVTLNIHRLGGCNTLFSNKSNYLVNFLAFLLNCNIRLVVRICYFSPCTVHILT